MNELGEPSRPKCPSISPFADMSSRIGTATSAQGDDTQVVQFAQRKRKWGTRTRTGCTTCRSRHVKCDESRPICNRCASAGRVCGGINYGTRAMGYRPPSSLVAGFGIAAEATGRPEPGGKGVAARPSPSSTIQLSRVRDMGMSRDLLPHGWHFSEACHYFNGVMLTRRLAKQIVPSDFHYPAGNTKQKFSPPPEHQHSVIMIALAHRISFIFHTDNCGTTELSRHTATAPLRISFYRHMGEAIRTLNHQLVAVDLPNIVWGLRKIANIVSAELYMVSVSWRHHVEGFLALVKHGGGIEKISDFFPPIRLALYYMIVLANVANTTSPSHDLGMGPLYPTEEETRKLYATTLYPSFPCPTDLFIHMMSITELRDQRSQRGQQDRLPSAMASRIVGIFADIDRFVPEHWSESYGLPKTYEITTIARIFKAAVALYGALALGKYQKSWIDLAVFFPSLTSAGRLTWQRLRMALSNHLLHMLEKAMGTLDNRESLSWPLTVLGAGIAIGTAADKDFVKDSLFDVGMDPNADAGPMDSRGQLMDFWQSGRSQWDECFTRPTMVLA